MSNDEIARALLFGTQAARHHCSMGTRGSLAMKNRPAKTMKVHAYREYRGARTLCGRFTYDVRVFNNWKLVNCKTCLKLKPVKLPKEPNDNALFLAS